MLTDQEQRTFQLRQPTENTSDTHESQASASRLPHRRADPRDYCASDDMNSLAAYSVAREHTAELFDMLNPALGTSHSLP